jgi:thiosulfate dehydrogenase
MVSMTWLDGAAITLTLSLALSLAGCVRNVSAVERGRELVSDPALSPARINPFACTHCHSIRSGDPSNYILPGAVLAGSTQRPTYWGGTILTLQDAIAICYRRFMLGGTLDSDREEFLAVYAFLESLESDLGAISTEVPFTVVRVALPPQPGDATSGAQWYNRACAYCHGAPRTGNGRLSDFVDIIPNVTEQEHTAAMGYDQESLRQVIVQKVRHGSFLGFAGSMPPFSLEALSNDALSDIIAYLDPQLQP